MLIEETSRKVQSMQLISIIGFALSIFFLLKSGDWAFFPREFQGPEKNAFANGNKSPDI